MGKRVVNIYHAVGIVHPEKEEMISVGGYKLNRREVQTGNIEFHGTTYEADELLELGYEIAPLVVMSSELVEALRFALMRVKATEEDFKEDALPYCEVLSDILEQVDESNNRRGR
jgi:hypothetical protein